MKIKKPEGPTPKQCDLIDEGARLTLVIKNSEDRMKEIKSLLSSFPVGNHVTRNNHVLVITERDNYIFPPESLLTELKKEGKQQLFTSCISVVKKKCDEILGKDYLAKIRKLGEPTKVMSFK
jgi:hypothetical protein